ncbi:MAG: riboflavin biosynthesis protein RibF [Candidatus Calescibacterium sp.]|nr:riboflavin biosynthesis protein RibF [Candidatus Calescibacterium sp.]MCX7972254.1 riboflavin biosynthesis protein RibF [bacterium]MDW8195144.1 riboflavin biosynthesis protein RibF [Candidatus Calescibacterium sp.]
MTGIALGFFDGIHIAHQKVIGNIYSDNSYVVTFDTSPKIFLKNYTNCLLTTNYEKEEIIRSLFPKIKIEFLIFKNIADLNPEQFIRYLKELINFDSISVGYDFRFGKNAQGDINSLKKLSRDYKFELIVQSPVKYQKKIVHSTLIRNYLINHPTKLEMVNSMLGRPYSITGLVIEGQKIGRKIGFPTANILVPHYKVVPYFGIYKVNVKILTKEFENRIFDGLLHIGPRPVINNYKISTEVWIRNFDKEIYYHPIKVELVKFIRKVKNFKNLKSMVKQIEKDIQIAFV